jgi:hypothetical protein
MSYKEMVKVTLADPQYRQQALDLCTEIIDIHKTSARENEKEPFVDLGYLNTSTKQYLLDKGHEIVRTVHHQRKGKKEIAGLEVHVVPLSSQGYEKSGMRVSVLAEGETPEELARDKKMKENILVEAFHAMGIPVNRVCVESIMNCQYKHYTG